MPGVRQWILGETKQERVHLHRLPAGSWQAGAWQAPGSPVCISAHPPDKSSPPPGTLGPTVWGLLPRKVGKGPLEYSAHSPLLAQAPGRDKIRQWIPSTQAWFLKGWCCPPGSLDIAVTSGGRGCKSCPATRPRDTATHPAMPRTVPRNNCLPTDVSSASLRNPGLEN